MSLPQSLIAAGRIISMKIPVTPWGIEPATFRFVAPCLNQLRHSVLPLLIYIYILILKILLKFGDFLYWYLRFPGILCILEWPFFPTFRDKLSLPSSGAKPSKESIIFPLLLVHYFNRCSFPLNSATLLHLPQETTRQFFFVMPHFYTIFSVYLQLFMLFSLTSAFLNPGFFFFRHQIPTLSFCSSLFPFFYHHRRRVLPLSSLHANPSSHFFAPGLVFICKKLTTSIMAYYPIAPLCCCCCLVSCFQAPFRPRSPNGQPTALCCFHRPSVLFSDAFHDQVNVLFATYSKCLHYWHF